MRADEEAVRVVLQYVVVATTTQQRAFGRELQQAATRPQPSLGPHTCLSSRISRESLRPRLLAHTALVNDILQAVRNALGEALDHELADKQWGQFLLNKPKLGGLGIMDVASTATGADMPVSSPACQP